MRTTSVEVVRIATKGPSDVSGLLTLSSRARSTRDQSSRYSGKPREMAVRERIRRFRVMHCIGRLCRSASQRVEERIAFMMSGDTGGVLSPHTTLFTRDAA